MKRTYSTWLLVVGAIGMLLAMAYLLGPHAGATDLARVMEPPSRGAWLGTDALGRDVLARVIVAAPLSLALALLAMLVASAIGIPLGALSALGGERIRGASARLIEIAMSFPSMLLALVIVLLLGRGGISAAVAVGIGFSPGFARTAQSLAIGVRNAEYLAAARVLGLSPGRRLVRYVLPNIAGPLAVKAAVDAGSALVTIAGFSFLGFGVQAPDYDWGRMLAQGLKALYVTPLPALVPGIAITLAGLGFNLLGDRLGSRTGGAGVEAPPREITREDDAVVAIAPNTALSVRGLHVRYGDVPVLDGVNLDIARGEALGLVGESGSGKTTLALAVAGLLPPGAEMAADAIALTGQRFHPLSEDASALLGKRVGFVFQDALSALNPLLPVGPQIAERLEIHGGLSRGEAKAQTIAALAAVGISEPERRFRQRPRQLSGGMRQRVLIAMGLATRPALLIADEPTTALDVTVQAQVITLMREATRRDGVALLFVSHDLAVVAQLCTRIAVLYAGRVVEVLDASSLAAGNAAHPYTRALVACLPAEGTTARLTTISGAVERVEVGCAFAPRCVLAEARCRVERPRLAPARTGGQVACWQAEEVE